MGEKITLDWFRSGDAQYHIRLTESTPKDQQDHFHDYYQVCYVVSGELIHRQEGVELPLGAGDAFIVPPGFIHSLHFNNSHTRIYSLAFALSLFGPGFSQTGAFRFLKELQSGDALRLRVLLDPQRRKLMEYMMDGLMRQREMDDQSSMSAAPSMVSAALYILAQSYYAQPQNEDKQEPAATYSSDMLRCVEYIDQNFRSPLTLGELSKKFGISQSTFCAVFPQFVGMSLKKYIAHKRITEAQALIRFYPQRSLGQIGAEVGYEDNSTFYRNFFRVTGVSPQNYRKMHTDLAYSAEK